MRVQIDKYIIKNCDERNLVIVEHRSAGKNPKTGEVGTGIKEITVGYYPNLEWALHKIKDLNISEVMLIQWTFCWQSLSKLMRQSAGLLRRLFVNATRLIGVLDSAIARPRARGNAKSIDDMWCDMAMQYTKRILEEEISAGGEFRRVVHAHWIEHEADFGESLYCECSSCHDSTGIECKLFCGACGAIMDEQTITVKDY